VSRAAARTWHGTGVAAGRPARLLLALGLAAGALAPALVATPAAAVEQTWSTGAADVAGAADLTKGGRGITIAVLDTWIEARHPDFGGRVRPGVTCSGGSCRPGSDTPDVCTPHGTHVSGIAAGRRFGVAPEATILPVRVLVDHAGQCTAESKDVAKGVDYAASHGAQVINISLGSTYPLTSSAEELTRAVADAARKNIVVVVAAGNGKASGSDVYGNSALVVAALGPNGKLASYSQRGPGVDLAAPGGDPGPPGSPCNPSVCVVSDWSDGGFAADAGTSMAAPYVAGAAALLLAQDPKRGRDDVAATLLRAARKLPEPAGAGALDVLAAVQKRTGTSTGSGTDTAPAAGAAAPAPVPAAGTRRPSSRRPSSRPSSAKPKKRASATAVAANPASDSSSIPSWGIPAVIGALVLVAGATGAAMAVQSRRASR